MSRKKILMRKIKEVLRLKFDEKWGQVDYFF